jgi:hypothetical protein
MFIKTCSTTTQTLDAESGRKAKQKENPFNSKGTKKAGREETEVRRQKSKEKQENALRPSSFQLLTPIF